jgi:hypothetical protein
MIPENSVSLSDKNLLHLGMQMYFWLFNKNKMQRWDYRLIWSLFLCLSNPHPAVAERHEAENHGN